MSWGSRSPLLQTFAIAGGVRFISPSAQNKTARLRHFATAGLKWRDGIRFSKHRSAFRCFGQHDRRELAVGLSAVGWTLRRSLVGFPARRGGGHLVDFWSCTAVEESKRPW